MTAQPTFPPTTSARVAPAEHAKDRDHGDREQHYADTWEQQVAWANEDAARVSALMKDGPNMHNYPSDRAAMPCADFYTWIRVRGD